MSSTLSHKRIQLLYAQRALRAIRLEGDQHRIPVLHSLDEALLPAMRNIVDTHWNDIVDLQREEEHA